MSTYGQYCPIAQALDVVGDRWTLLIIRDMLTGTQHFNHLERGLPGISRGLLSQRLRQLQQSGIVEKEEHWEGRQRFTSYHLTDAGLALNNVIRSLMYWGVAWSFGDPSPEVLDPLLLLWWMHDRTNRTLLPEQWIVVQFDFYGAQTATYWLLLSSEDVTLCQTHPGFDADLLVTADLATLYQVWLGRMEYGEALDAGTLRLEGIPRYARAFPTWFKWSPAAPAVRATRLEAAGGDFGT
ncbi:winged helix-turn-helix transcriptional regulator [Aggregatilinea lenta]|uniref:winged helix-turn-helix transcriptional regulator n=1 Tax=Aggregatilinea lenta TaxID=913108 RepID=UPI000E5A6BAB|nr:helix-turn-helix domain-containing protein [Aggregatilinea lenta]